MSALATAPRVSVVIPTWNGCELVVHALRSLHRQTWRDFEVVVVDNGSTDGTLARIAAEFPEVRTIAFVENRGFAPAANAGIAASAGEVVVLMNNDTEADPGWLTALVAALDRHPEAAVAASRMLDYEDRTRIDSIGVQFGLFASNIGHGQPDGPRFARSRYVFAGSAGAAAYRKRVLDKVGVFDEGFFAYCEDVDLGARILLEGYRCIYVPDAIIYHRGSVTANRMPDRKFYLLMRNALTLFFRYAPPRRLVWGPAVLGWPFIRALIDRQPQRLAMQAVLDFLRDVPAVLRTRRAVMATRRITAAEFAATLASPFARDGREPRLFAGRSSGVHTQEATLRRADRLERSRHVS